MAYKLFTGYKLLVLHFNKALAANRARLIQELLDLWIFLEYWTRGIELIESWVIEV